MTKEMGQLDFSKSAETIFYLWKWFTPWPWIFAYYHWKKIIFDDCDYLEEDWSDISNKNHENYIENRQMFKNNDYWCVIKVNKEIWVRCGKWVLLFKKIKLEWERQQLSTDFINWHKDFLGQKLN
jgi:methionyl-tRNA formyltransferase